MCLAFLDTPWSSGPFVWFDFFEGSPNLVILIVTLFCRKVASRSQCLQYTLVPPWLADVALMYASSKVDLDK